MASALCSYSHNTDAIPDRIVHQAHRIKLKGTSLRKIKKARLEGSN
jgi:hypothetical protein